ncbi:MAG TPA: glycosyltransferase family 39 protein [Anaerolineae bacterium]|nr:glycosyltransferase family 39 protein [Anaerolineae bacterium]
MSARWALVALLGDYLLAALAFGAVIPVFEQPDEHTHYYFAQHVAQTGELPVQAAEQDARGPWEQEGSQPPLYYLLAAPLVRLAGGDLADDGLWYNDQNTMGTPALVGNENRFIHDPAREGWPWRGYALAAHLGRLLSSLFGLITVLSVFLVARRVLGGRAWLGIAAAALVAFNPQFLAVSSTFGNDALIIALSSAALALLLVVWDQLEAGAEPADLAKTVPVLAVIVGLAPLAKISGLTLLAFTVGTLAWLSWRRRSWTILMATVGPLLLAAASLAGWWYLRNLRLYGDLLGFSRMHPGGTLREGFTWLDWLRTEAFGELKGVWLSSWGLFGWFTILLPAWVYAAITTLCAGALVALARWGRRLRDLDRGRLTWLALWGALVTASLLRWLSITKGGQGRLLFPALAAGAVLLVAGLAAALGRWRTAFGSLGSHKSHKSYESHGADGSLGIDRPDGTYRTNRTYETHETDDRRLALGLYALMFLFAAACLFGVIRPAYAAPRRIPLAELPADAVPAGVVFGEGLRLVALQRPERVRAGETFAVTLYWQVERAITRDGLVALETEFISDGTDTVDTSTSGARLAYPGAGNRPPRLLTPGPWVYVDRREMPGATGASDQPVGGRLRISVYDPGAKQSWPIPDSPERESWPVDLVIDPLRRASLTGKLIARFDNGVSLLWPADTDDPFAQHTLRLTTKAIGDSLGGLFSGWQDDVLWSVERPPGEDLQVFVHLLDAEGKQLNTFDRPLQTQVRYAARQWQAGDTLPGIVYWSLDPVDNMHDEELTNWLAKLPGARFTIAVGLYRPGDGSRIPAFAPDGRRLKDDTVVLHEVEVTGP